MTDALTETKFSKQAVLFACGGINKVAKQFADMLKYCRNKHLHITDVFFETSALKAYERANVNKLMDYLKHNKTQIAVVFYSKNDSYQLIPSRKIKPFIDNDKMEIHFVKDNIVF